MKRFFESILILLVILFFLLPIIFPGLIFLYLLEVL